MKKLLTTLALPLLLIAYPILYLYGHNAPILTLGSLTFPLGASLLVACFAFAFFWLVLRSRVAASLAAAAFVIFYYLYGFVYRTLLNLDRVQVEHFTLLPLVMLLAVYAGSFLARVRPALAAILQKSLLIFATLLVLINLVITVPVEVKKALPGRAAVPHVQASAPDSTPAPGRISAASSTSAAASTPAARLPITGGTAAGKTPDIYYIIFDEYVGFDAMRDYWHDDLAAQFNTYLKDNHFFVAINSRSPTINTTTEMASRLNLWNVPATADQNTLLASLTDNKVMQILKAHGYTTVSINMAYTGLHADVNANFDPRSVSGLAADQFRRTFVNDTMFSAFSAILQSTDPDAARQRDIILYSLDRTAALADVKSPKFVYTHLLLPHPPFIFDENGNLLPPQDWNDWHYYLGQYKFATKQAMQLVSRLLANADPANPPVIILQSDEGARNLQTRTPDNIITNGYLEDYPGMYNQYILNALYLPGYDTAQLSDALPPVDTFVLVLNHYLNAGVSVSDYPGK